jgi:transcriptional regulator with XRE-family HTH domain
MFMADPVITKNPTAVKIGNRIKQARKMAGYETAAQLNEHLPDWSASRLGNYEAGISTPSPGDVERIAAITGSSPCWITFGIGPIRASSRDLQAIRHQNLSFLVDELKSTPARLRSLLQNLGISRKKLDELIDNPFTAIQDRYARRCEKFLKKPQGWMDEQHVESDPLCMNFPEDLRELMSIYSELDEADRNKLLQIAKVFSAQAD